MTFAAILGMRLGIRVYGQKRRDANRHGGDTPANRNGNLGTSREDESKGTIKKEAFEFDVHPATHSDSI